ncbi:MAG TPA: cyclodeaminase/cyclohydrolase family protein [Bryobacteraceae bacterium]|nr:cyclodeaminase/cyclohydrolase family protein [Bryobacteraceae bacterium]
MKSPIRKSTIEAVRQHIADARDPIAAGVAVASVSAGLGLALLAMTLQVTSRRKSFSGDRACLKALLNAANKESGRLLRYADQDIATYQKYRESLRRKSGVDAARRRIIETPLEAASSAAQGLDLCAEAMSLVPQSVVSDVGAAAEVLAGAVRAILLTVDVNLREVPAGSKLRREWDKKRKELGRRVSQR